jgi:CRISPR-associated protein Cas2
MRSTYLVCYDIADDKRRTRIFKTCKNFGDHLQFSVFECDLNPTELHLLQRELLQTISPNQDQILIITLGPSEGRGDRVIASLGKPYSKIDSPCFVI